MQGQIEMTWGVFWTHRLQSKKGDQIRQRNHCSKQQTVRRMFDPLHETDDEQSVHELEHFPPVKFLPRTRTVQQGCVTSKG
jgi:hypothetical protein